MRRALGVSVVAAVALGGCVDRRIVITSDPAGARVALNDADVGVTPVEVNFTYFGTYDVRLRKDGYEPVVTTAEAEAPIHEWPGVDLVALLIPVEKRTIIRWHFELEASERADEGVLERARGARAMLGASSEQGDEASEEDPSQTPKERAGG